MARRRTYDEFLYELKKKNVNVEIIGTYVNNTTKIKCRCPKHNKIYYTTPKILLLHENTNCCPECLSEFRSDNSRLPYETFLKRLKEKDIDVIPIEGYDGLDKKMTFKCSCGELWITTPSRVLLGNHCKKCGYR